MLVSLTVPLAIIVAAVLIAAAGIAGFLVAAKLFGNRVRDLATALEESNKRVWDHKAEVDASLAEIRSAQALLSTTINNKKILKEFSKDTVRKAKVKEDGPTVDALADQLRDDWEAIRSQIEALAAAETIDRTTRVRYATMDRRKFTDLVEVLAKENVFGDKSEDFEKATAIWAKYRYSRAQPSTLDVATMAHLRKALVPAVA